MYVNEKILMAKNNDKEYYIIPKMANRHGLIAGGTGSGKTVTLKVMAESFSNAGVPVFLADVKGDLAGMCQEGIDSDDMKARIEKFKLNDYGFSYQKYPTQFFEIERKYGLPVRTTISDFGPTLLSHIFELNQTQSDILNVIFKIADDQGLLLLDLKDLKKMLEYVGDYFLSVDAPLIDDKDVSTLEVLAPVPSWEQWQQMKAFCEEFNALNVVEENQKLKELLKECREVVEFTKTIVNKHTWFDKILIKINGALK